MKFSSILVLLLCGSAIVDASQIMTTDDPVKRTPTTSFSCRQKVYVLVDWNPVPTAGNHALMVSWFNPHGVVERTTRVPVTGVATWSWLEFEQPQGSGLLRGVFPDRGYENFIGCWKADVSFDGQPIGTVHFSVEC